MGKKFYIVDNACTPYKLILHRTSNYLVANDWLPVSSLVEADVGIAMGSGADVAIESAPITINSHSIGKIYQGVKLSKKTFRIIKQNLGWAFFYNLVLIPFAVAGRLSPMLASAAMAASSLCVVFNGVRLLRFR